MSGFCGVLRGVPQQSRRRSTFVGQCSSASVRCMRGVFPVALGAGVTCSQHPRASGFVGGDDGAGVGGCQVFQEVVEDAVSESDVVRYSRREVLSGVDGASAPQCPRWLCCCCLASRWLPAVETRRIPCLRPPVRCLLALDPAAVVGLIALWAGRLLAVSPWPSPPSLCWPQHFGRFPRAPRKNLMPWMAARR